MERALEESEGHPHRARRAFTAVRRLAGAAHHRQPPLDPSPAADAPRRRLRARPLPVALFAGLCLAGILLVAGIALAPHGGEAVATPDAAPEEVTTDPLLPKTGAPAREGAGKGAEAAEPAEPPIDPAPLTAILGEELSAKLIRAAEVNEDVRWIATHPEAYAAYGERVQFKLLRLAANEPAAMAFVRAFPDAYPAEAASGSTPDPVPGQVPHLYQWDQRWGYTPYCSTALALTGCCPTAFAMVYQGLTGRGDLSPFDMAVRAREGGYMDEFNGTYAAFLEDEAARLGIVAGELGTDAESLTAALAEGKLVIVNVGPGDFTDGGHYIVVRGLDEYGMVRVNDPNSVERSGRVWDPQAIASQAKIMYSFRLA